MKCSAFRERAFEGRSRDPPKLTSRIISRSCADCREWNRYPHSPRQHPSRPWRANLASESAGADVEIRLLAAMREQHARQPPHEQRHSAGTAGARDSLRVRWSASLLRRSSSSPPAHSFSVGQPDQDLASPVATTPSPAPQIAAVPSVHPALPRRVAPRPATDAATQSPPTHSEPTSTSATEPVVPDTLQAPDTASVTTTEEVAIAESSEAPFIVLQADDTMMDEGQIIRVELSPERARSAGLPVDPRAGRASSIRADVVVGRDGVARTIRMPKDR